MTNDSSSTIIPGLGSITVESVLESAGATVRDLMDRVRSQNAEIARLGAELAMLRPAGRCAVEKCKGTAMPGLESEGLCSWCWLGAQRARRDEVVEGDDE